MVYSLLNGIRNAEGTEKIGMATQLGSTLDDYLSTRKTPSNPSLGKELNSIDGKERSRWLSEAIGELKTVDGYEQQAKNLNDLFRLGGIAQVAPNFAHYLAKTYGNLSVKTMQENPNAGQFGVTSCGNESGTNKYDIFSGDNLIGHFGVEIEPLDGDIERVWFEFKDNGEPGKKLEFYGGPWYFGLEVIVIRGRRVDKNLEIPFL